MRAAGLSALRPARIVVGLSIFAVVMTTWWALIAHNLARAENAVAPIPYPQRYSMVLGADFDKYRDFFRDYPKTLSQIRKANVFTDYHKRPLFGPVSAALTLALATAGIVYPQNMLFILSLYATCSIFLFYFLMRLLDFPAVQSALLTLTVTLSFAWLSVFSIPESYSLTISAALIAIMSSIVQFRRPRADIRAAALKHAAVSGVAGWLYLPLCGAVFLIVPQLRSRRQLLTVMAPSILVTLVVASTAFLVRYADGSPQEFVKWSEEWVSFAHFSSPGNWRDVTASFLLFSAVSPVKDVLLAAPTPDWSEIGGNWVVVNCAFALIVGYAFAVRCVIKRDHGRSLSGMALWFAALTALYVFFNPREVLLYLALPFTLVLVMLAMMLSAERKRGQQRIIDASILAGTLYSVAWMAYANVRTVFG